MKHMLTILLLALASLSAKAQKREQSPLGKYSKEWNNPKYLVCNTAKNTPYLSADEKQLIYVLNLARMNPPLFRNTVLTHVLDICRTDTSSAYYYKSLMREMAVMKPLPILKPDTACFQSAYCHATTSGERGYTGHERQSEECKKKRYFNGECCQYGIRDPLSVVVCLLVDEGVESLGHRHICLGTYNKMSPSYAKHRTYGSVTVLDFAY